MTEERTIVADTKSKTEQEVLRVFALLMSARLTKSSTSDKKRAVNPHHWSDIAWESDQNSSKQSTSNNADDDDDEEEDYGFSSFPSLSLEHVPDNKDEEVSSQQDKEKQIEARVTSHLARPILVSNRPLEQDDNEDNDNALEKEDFMAPSVSEVPDLMMQNFFKSFGVLMNSRLRAYAVFLAQHGLSLYKTSETAQELEDGVTSVEQKLETMLDIGNMVVSDSVLIHVVPHPERATSSAREGEEDDAKQLRMPLTWTAAIDIAIPNVFVPGRHMQLSVQFETTGSLTGVFPTDSPSKNALIRVAQLDLDIPSLLRCMREQAARVITSIIEMTNAAHSLPLPVIPAESGAEHIMSLMAPNNKRGALEENDDKDRAKRARID